jgi:hypothetical protein
MRIYTVLILCTALILCTVLHSLSIHRYDAVLHDGLVESKNAWQHHDGGVDRCYL